MVVVSVPSLQLVQENHFEGRIAKRMASAAGLRVAAMQKIWASVPKRQQSHHGMILWLCQPVNESALRSIQEWSLFSPYCFES